MEGAQIFSAFCETIKVFLSIVLSRETKKNRIKGINIKLFLIKISVGNRYYKMHEKSIKYKQIKKKISHSKIFNVSVGNMYLSH